MVICWGGLGNGWGIAESKKGEMRGEGSGGVWDGSFGELRDEDVRLGGCFGVWGFWWGALSGRGNGDIGGVMNVLVGEATSAAGESAGGGGGFGECVYAGGVSLCVARGNAACGGDGGVDGAADAV